MTRAIPWVFAWTQNRCLLPAWYGCGTAFAGASCRELHRLYREWPFFRSLVENLEMTLAKSSRDRHPVLQRSIRLRNPYVDPMNAIQVELLRRHRDPAASEAAREHVRRPLLRSIAPIAAALRNTG